MNNNKTPEEIALELVEINNRLEQLKKIKSKFDEIEIAKSQECCPDVCETINQLELAIDNEMSKISYEEKSVVGRINLFPKEFRESILLKNKLRTNKAIKALELRHKELTNLKTVLSKNSICNCD